MTQQNFIKVALHVSIVWLQISIDFKICTKASHLLNCNYIFFYLFI